MITDTDATHDYHTCTAYDEVYPTERPLVPYRGARHPDGLDDEEVEVYRGTHHEREAELKSFRVCALGVIVLLHFGFLILLTVFAS